MQQGNSSDFNEVWEAAVDRLPELSPDEQRVGLALLGELTQGEPVSPSRLGRALGISDQDTERYLQGSGMSPLVYSNDEGSAVGFFGLSTRPTDHRFIVNGRTLWTWCAADTLFLPELVDATAAVESREPQTGDPVRLTVSPTAIESATPESVMVSMNSPAAWETTSAMRLIVTACHYIHFFTSPESGRRWTDEHPDTVVVPLDDAFIYARRQNRRMFGSQLAGRSSGGA